MYLICKSCPQSGIAFLNQSAGIKNHTPQTNFTVPGFVGCIRTGFKKRKPLLFIITYYILYGNSFSQLI